MFQVIAEFIAIALLASISLNLLNITKEMQKARKTISWYLNEKVMGTKVDKLKEKWTSKDPVQ